ncbi:VTC domain-containing protein [Peribacillus sp. Hz7]|uniref:VTC domain-containing protein n=1 Tax=Peribacillus sp. Hz7 TaxID=3344873 RepID=UPI0035C9621F
MAIEVFNRHEKKYMIDVDTFSKIQMRLADYMELDAYNKNNAYYTIANLYYDTADDDLIRHSISKPVFKEKLRMRGYGTPSLDSKVYIEIKKKVNGIVNKRRSSMKLKEAYGFLQSGIAPTYQPYMNQQVLGEIESFLTQYQLKPAVYLAYDRMAYFGKGNRDLRMSFDFNIRSRRSELMLEAGDHGQLDEQRMERVIYNLIGNAINYIGEDKEIKVNLIDLGSRVRFEVIDTGKGIPSEELNLIWDRYYKAKTHKRSIISNGLGLSIVKSILEMHQAEFGIESAVGKGSTFWFELRK